MKPKQALALIERLPPATLPEFDYSAIPPDVATDAREVAERVRERHRASIVETGRDLIAVKERLGHGHFIDWIEAEFGWSRFTADRFMNVAREFGDACCTVQHLPATILYQLAAPSTPGPLREEIVRRIEGGERPHASEVGRIVKAARQSERKRESRQKTQEQEEAKRAAFLAKLPEAERTRLLRKEHRQELREAQGRAELEAERQLRERDHALREARAREAVEFLRERLGSEFARFVELVTASVWEFETALRETVEPKPPVKAREQQIRALKQAAGLFDNLEGSA
jgi:Protein of unknown function (DUF3102)